MIRIDVIGTPAPKGSKKAVRHNKTGRIVLVDDNPKKKRVWHEAVAAAALIASRGRVAYKDEPLHVRMVFRLARPKGHYGKRGLLPSAPDHPSVKPDIDKLARATIDPLMGSVFDEDSRIVAMWTVKRYCTDGEQPGALVYVWSMQETPP